MKPKWHEWIPVYGFVKYFRRYFLQNKTTYKDVVFAEWFNLYHLLVMVITILIIKIFI